MLVRLVPKLCIVVLVMVASSLPVLARPYLLLDADDGTVLMHRQAFDRWYPASLTKIMTAYVVFEAVKSGEITMKSPVRVSKYARTKPPSKMGLPVGSVLNFENALKVILVKSANDIAVSIAESLSGSEEAFARRMNATAARLGMVDTNFVNSHGLHDPMQYSTARDLGLLAMAIYRDFPQYTYMLKIPELQYAKRRLKSFNRMLGRYPGADGIKTGYICAAGFNIAASASRAGRRLIAIVLGAKNAHERGIQTAKLLNAGFDGTYGQSAGPISKLEPYGKARNIAKDLSGKICDRSKPKIKETRKQRNARWKAEAIQREAENALYFTPRLPIKPVRIVLGDAFGPSPTGIEVINGNTPPPYIPIPKRRPDYQLAGIDGTSIPQYTGPSGTIPLPKPRPHVSQ